jgi:hypothetical protein
MEHARQARPAQGFSLLICALLDLSFALRYSMR